MMFSKTLVALFAVGSLFSTVASFAESEMPSGHAGEGITIHGHWRIQITNADGSIDRVVAFENEFVGGGLLAQIMAGEKSIGNWVVQIGADTDSLCDTGGGAVGPCLALEVDPGEGGGSGSFGILTATAETTQIALKGGAVLHLLKLEGSVAISNSGQISSVTTAVANCAPDVAPQHCQFFPVPAGASGFGGVPMPPSAGLSPFTRKVLNNPESVTAGQSVQVTVTIRFS